MFCLRGRRLPPQLVEKLIPPFQEVIVAVTPLFWLMNLLDPKEQLMF